MGSRQYNLVVDTFEEKKEEKIYIQQARTPPPPARKIKKKDKNKCSFSSSLFCSRLHISCAVGSGSDDDNVEHDEAARIPPQSGALRSVRTGCALTNTNAMENSKKLVFCYDDE